MTRLKALRATDARDPRSSRSCGVVSGDIGCFFNTMQPIDHDGISHPQRTTAPGGPSFQHRCTDYTIKTEHYQQLKFIFETTA